MLQAQLSKGPRIAGSSADWCRLSSRVKPRLTTARKSTLHFTEERHNGNRNKGND